RLANVLRVQFVGGWVDGRPSRTKSRFLLSCYQATRATLSHDTTHTLSTGSGAKGGTLSTGSGANKIYRREIQDQKRTDPADGSRTVAAVGQKPAMKDNPNPTHRPNGQRLDPSVIADQMLSSCPHTPSCTSASLCGWYRILDANVKAGWMTPAAAARLRGRRKEMARRLPQTCRYPGCPRLDCAEHRELRRPWASAVPIDRGTSHQNRKWREALFARTPLCAHCRAQGRMTVATIRDHIVPLAHGGTEDVD